MQELGAVKFYCIAFSTAKIYKSGDERTKGKKTKRIVFCRLFVKLLANGSMIILTSALRNRFREWNEKKEDSFDDDDDDSVKCVVHQQLHHFN